MTSLDYQGMYSAVPWLCFSGWDKRGSGVERGGVLRVSECPVLLSCVLSKACLVSEH